MQEREIIEQIRERREEGLQALQKQYGPLLRYVIAPILPFEEDREECFSDVLLRIWNRIGSFSPEKGSFRAWLTAVARHAAIDKARAGRRPSEELTEALPDGAPSPEEALLRQERREALVRAVAGLPAQEQILFYRKYYYGQPSAQIAAEWGMTERAVEGRLYRLRKHLQDLLEGERL